MWLLVLPALLVVGFLFGGVTGMLLPVIVVYGLPLAFAVAVAFALYGVTAGWRERRAWRRSDSDAARRALSNWG